MPYRSVESRVFNFSFGCVRAGPIRFSWRSPELAALTKSDVEFSAELFNHAELLNAENQFVAFHSLENKQNLGHNFRAAAHTGYLRLTYLDFPADYTYQFVEQGNLFLTEVVAPILSFFQRSPGYRLPGYGCCIDLRTIDIRCASRGIQGAGSNAYASI